MKKWLAWMLACALMALCPFCVMAQEMNGSLTFSLPEGASTLRIPSDQSQQDSLWKTLPDDAQRDAMTLLLPGTDNSGAILAMMKNGYVGVCFTFTEIGSLPGDLSSLWPGIAQDLQSCFQSVNADQSCVSKTTLAGFDATLAHTVVTDQQGLAMELKLYAAPIGTAILEADALYPSPSRFINDDEKMALLKSDITDLETVLASLSLIANEPLAVTDYVDPEGRFTLQYPADDDAMTPESAGIMLEKEQDALCRYWLQNAADTKSTLILPTDRSYAVEIGVLEAEEGMTLETIDGRAEAIAQYLAKDFSDVVIAGRGDRFTLSGGEHAMLTFTMKMEDEPVLLIVLATIRENTLYEVDYWIHNSVNAQQSDRVMNILRSIQYSK